MEHNVFRMKDILLVYLKGEINVTNSMELKKVMQKAIEENNKKILIDFKDVEFIDSSGLSVFVAAHKLISEKGGSLKFTNVKPHVQKVFNITRMDMLFDIYNSLEQAELSFK